MGRRPLGLDLLFSFYHFINHHGPKPRRPIMHPAVTGGGAPFPNVAEETAVHIGHVSFHFIYSLSEPVAQLINGPYI